jgi:hypothetical protein
MGIDPSIIDLHYRFAHHWPLSSISFVFFLTFVGQTCRNPYQCLKGLSQVMDFAFEGIGPCFASHWLEDCANCTPTTEEK